MKLFQDSPLDLIPENSIVRLSSFSSSSSSFSSIPVYRYIAFLRASFNEGQLLSVLTSLEKLAGSRRPKGERSVAQSEGSHGGGNRRGFVLKFRERKSSSGQTPGAKSGTERAERTKEKGSFVRCANARVSDEIVNKKKKRKRQGRHQLLRSIYPSTTGRSSRSGPSVSSSPPPFQSDSATKQTYPPLPSCVYRSYPGTWCPEQRTRRMKAEGGSG